MLSANNDVIVCKILKKKYKTNYVMQKLEYLVY